MQEIATLVAQYNEKDRKIKSANVYRKQIFTKIKQYIQNQMDINDIILLGDLNQSIYSSEVKSFYNKLGLKDIYQWYNKIEEGQMNNTCMIGSEPIDSVAATINILQIVEGCKLIETNDIIITDHRSHIINFNFEEYFCEQFSDWD